MKAYETKKKKIIINELVNTLSNLCLAKCISSDTPPEQWPSTREIADKCQLGIYQTRYFLLLMEKKNLVISTSMIINNALRWRVHID